MRVTDNEVVEILSKLLSFYEPMQSLADSHFASFFSENSWGKEIPPEIQQELGNSRSISDFIELYPEIIQNNCPSDFADKHPNLVTYVSTAVNLFLLMEGKYSKTLDELENLFLAEGYSGNCDFKMEAFMSHKKLHEVKILSRVTAVLSDLTKSSHVVDVGGGKGYLSSVLALHHRHKVLGLDSSEVKTCGASKMSEKVAKLWGDSIPAGAGGEINGKRAKEDFIRRHYKQVTTFVRPETNVGRLLGESFREEVGGVTLTGLHTCGDLAPTCLEMFLRNEMIRGVVNVGCCYHLISGGCDERPGSCGFPVSDYLKGRKFSLGRNARMVAAYSLGLVKSKSKFEFAVTSIFYRAILDTVIKAEGGTSRRDGVGRIAKKCRNFREYMRKALEKLDMQMSEEEVQQLHESFIPLKPTLTAFFLLRVTLAPVIESIILLDRILHLIEKGTSNAYLVRAFDLEISPRGFGVVAWKDF